MKKELLVCTFSGGRTSAFMARFISELPKYKDNYDIVFIFCNTGRERPETLQFVKDCEDNWGLNIVWLEAEIMIRFEWDGLILDLNTEAFEIYKGFLRKEKGISKTKFKRESKKYPRGTTYKIVSFNTASRNGEPFENMLKKYPMPNNFASNCTRELKIRPIEKYIKSLGYNKYITAMGIRKDEEHRRSNNAIKDNIIYPLMDDIQVDSNFIRNWWDKQPFDLKLKDYEGNCDLCFKKSTRKKLTIIKENPSVSDWWLNMEQKYSNDKIPRFDLRTNHSIIDLVELTKSPFKTVQDQHELNKTQVSLFDDMDLETDCFCKIS